MVPGPGPYRNQTAHVTSVTSDLMLKAMSVVVSLSGPPAIPAVINEPVQLQSDIVKWESNAVQADDVHLIFTLLCLIATGLAH